MKPVLVSQRLVENSGYKEIREALDVQWGRFLLECGFLPVPVAANVPAQFYFDTLKPVGVLLTGGNDLAAFAPHDLLSLERDRIEKELIESALQNKIPVIGVCRGMQMLAHYHGCSLEKKPDHVVPAHEIQIQTATRFGALLGKTKLDVNSFHNYCVTGLKGDLREVARHTKDGTFEAFENPQKKIYGMMWHPERVDPFSELDIRFFREVFQS